MNAYLEKIYYDTKHPAGYSRPYTLYEQARRDGKNYSVKQIQNWLEGQETYTLHKSARRRFPRNRIYVRAKDHQWEIDLVDMSALKKDNRDIRYLLTCIDVLSKFAWAIPLKRKTGEALVVALETLFAQGRKPQQIRADKGGEFVNRKVAALLKTQGIHFFTANNETKASVVERFNRTLKNYMWRYFTHQNTRKYIDKLPDFLHAYNHRVHRSIKMRPVDVTLANEHEVYKTLYDRDRAPMTVYKFKVGDTVRISKAKAVFDKGYLPNWTREIFTISQVLQRHKPLYKIKDSQGEELEGTFYGKELQKVTPPTYYQIEKVLDTRGRGARKEFLVKWMGYPNSANTWLPQNQIKDLI